MHFVPKYVTLLSLIFYCPPQKNSVLVTCLNGGSQTFIDSSILQKAVNTHGPPLKKRVLDPFRTKGHANFKLSTQKNKIKRKKVFSAFCSAQTTRLRVNMTS